MFENNNDPINALTMRTYQGKNLSTLIDFMFRNGFTSPRFATLKQWNQLGRCIVAGSKSCPIFWVDNFEGQPTHNRKTYNSFRVFNIEQTRLYTAEEQERYARSQANNSGYGQSNSVSIAG